MKKIVFWLSVCAFVILAGTPVYAKGTCDLCPRAESDQYGTKAPAALGRGIVNTGFGFTEIFAQPIKESKAGGNAAVGFGKGIGQFVVRELKGAAEIATFWIPGVHQREIENSCAFGTMGLADR